MRVSKTITMDHVILLKIEEDVKNGKFGSIGRAIESIVEDFYANTVETKAVKG